MEERTGAEFRAMRDTIGWTQREAGDAMGFPESTVKKWENPKAGWDVLPVAWDWMDKRMADHVAEVDRLIEKAHKVADSGKRPINFAYFRNGMRTGGAPAGAMNARAREAASFIESEGYPVRFVWAYGEEDAIA